MKVIEPGHIYQLQHLDGSGAGILVFVNREPGTEHEGAQTQEVLRVLIDRTQHCDECLRWDGNDKIIYHLRMAIALHEARALLRKTEKGVIEPEKVPTGKDGHFKLSIDPSAGPTWDELAAKAPKRRFDECPGCGKIDGCVCPDRGFRQPEHRDYVAAPVTDGSTPFEPTTIGASATPYGCNVPMCGESGVCDECRKRGAR